MNRKHALILFLALAVLAGLLAKSERLKAQTAVFINEIHYDNASTDVGEAIEIAGPAGTDLTGWSLVLYNGSGGVVYSTTPLNGTIPAQQNGYGTIFVSYPTNGIQNGAPDGMALVDAANIVVQFLSYEGAFVATDGPAAGLTSIDIGVSQSGAGAIGNSLQLAGSGATYEDFAWTPEQPNTFGAVNTGQSFGGTVAPTDPLLNEFVFNHTGTDTHEFVEVAGDANTDYSTYTVLQIEGDSTGAGVIDGVLAVGTTNGDGYWTTGFLSNAYENGTVTLLLVEGFSGAVGNDLDLDNDGVLDVTPWTRIVDDVAVSDGGADDRAYSSTILAPGFSGNPFTPGGASRIPDRADTDSVADWVVNDFDGEGLPGFAGTPDPGEALNTPGAPNALVSVGPPTNVIINEVDSDTPGTDILEFVELYDGGGGNTSLDGLVVVFYNGSNDLSYAAFDLDGFSTDANGYFLLGNAAVNPLPAVIFSDNFLQNGQDAVALYVGDASDFPSGTAVTPTNLIDAIVYDTNDADDPGLLVLLNPDQPQVNESGGGDSANQSNQRCPNGAGGPRNTDTYTQALPTPGAENNCGGTEIQEAKIHEVQSSGSSVAITDPVLVEAIVVGDFQADDQLRGFFIQEEDSDADADPNTSEGIFVFCPGCATDVTVGDLVQVAGQPVDFFGMSQIDTTVAVGQVAVLGSNNPLPTPVLVDLPASGSTRGETTFEHVEGMLVTFADTLVVSEYFELARYGQLVLTADARPRQFTDANEPGIAEYAAFLEDLNSKRIILDDDNNIQNDAISVGVDEPYFWPRPGLSNSNLIRGGDSISGLTGVLHWSFAGQSGTDAWRVRPVEEAFTYDFTAVNERPFQPENVGGSFKVASFNVLNYFTTIDSRGADSLAELDRQRAKIAAAICGMDADVVGLIEIENNGSVALFDLLNGFNGINANCGPYGAIDTGVIGTDEIAVAFIYKTATVNPVGGYAVLDSSVDPRFLDDKNRPALAQTFAETATGAKLTVVVNHLKSKGSDCNDVGDPDVFDGQGNCNLTRKWAAEAMVDWLATDPTGSGDSDFLIIGDLNSYRNEDPIDALEAGGYVDLLNTLIGPSAYTYLFDGQLGYLDHALANDTLFDQVTGVTVWHLNADEIPVFDYNDDIRDPGEQSFERESGVLPVYEPNAFRSSDHDPVIVGLDLNAPPDCSGATASRDVLWPVNHKMVAIEIMGVTDPDGDPLTITIDSIFQDEPVSGIGSGNTAPDGAGVGTTMALVRAERSGEGNGRVYHIYFTATDAFGNNCSGKVLVSVPLAIPFAAVDDGPLFDSTLIQ